MIRRTRSGHEFCEVVALYGRMVPAWSEEYRAACEARVILEKPREERPEFMQSIARRRGRTDEEQKIVFDALSGAVTAEWDWRKKQREATS
ncbi:hypothetical protein [Parvibaculum sp.]|uniref:DUF7696 family protein n=1 Tax=Parvibaculum sp. TaxID=2024848 RepID=UPI002732C36A|nr:hypothetical protein [Parvibaculum sp.]MDP3328755.1 hypothetical protein [Parvibaculum sp.]